MCRKGSGTRRHILLVICECELVRLEALLDSGLWVVLFGWIAEFKKNNPWYMIIPSCRESHMTSDVYMMLSIWYSYYLLCWITVVCTSICIFIYILSYCTHNYYMYTNNLSITILLVTLKKNSLLARASLFRHASTVENLSTCNKKVNSLKLTASLHPKIGHP